MNDMTDSPDNNIDHAAGLQLDHNLDLLQGVSLRISVEVGSTSIKLIDLMKLDHGSVIELDRQSNDLLDIFANGTLIARGEIINVDNRYGIRIAEVVAPDRHLGGIERRS